MRFQRILPAALLGTALVFSACGSSSSSSAAKASSTTAVSKDFNDNDVSFAQGMIPHHQQAVEMASEALTNASDAQVKDLATRIKAAQGPEIAQMTSWLTTWGKPAKADAAMGSMGHDSSASDGMMTDAEMTSLGKLTGAAFDKAFLNMMIRHHQGAVAMATTEQTNGKNQNAKDLAARIIKAQNIEITEMTATAKRLA